MIYFQARSNGREAYIILDQACRRDITDLELNQLNQEFDNSSIEADVGVTINSITNFGRHLTGVNTRRPEPMRKNDSDLTLLTKAGRRRDCLAAHSQAERVEREPDKSRY